MQKNQGTGFGFHQHPLLFASSSFRKSRGLMDNATIGGLFNSISRFIHLVACHNQKIEPVHKDYRKIVSLLKLLKPVLDEVVDSKIPPEGSLLREFEELDVAVNEARELMENWHPKMSKICSVLQSGPLVVKVWRSSLEICHLLNKFLQSSLSTSHLSSVQHCMQELQYEELERTSEIIEEALRDQRNNLLPCSEHMMKIVHSLGLASNQELLMESVALEKDRVKAQLMKNKGEAEYIEQITAFVSHIRRFLVNLKQHETINGKSVPSYFLCPLSGELMLDPVIVASGQTFERAFIQRWFDQGLKICPTTHQSLAHTNLIPNFTVKALITNWCEKSSINLPDSIESTISRNRDSETLKIGRLCKPDQPVNAHQISLSSDEASEDFHRADDFHGSCLSNSTSVSILEIENGFEKKRDEYSSRNCEEESKSEQKNPCCGNHHQIEDSSHSRSESVSSTFSSIDYILPESDTVDSLVLKLVEDLKSESIEAQTAAASELRFLTKNNMENRVRIANCRAVPPLVSLLYSTNKMTQENAVTALLNLSINDSNKITIAEEGAIEPLIHVLQSGNPEAKENSAATLFSLSVLEEYKIKIGRSGAVRALVDLLGHGTLRGKKDAATALFNLSIFHENKARIVKAGAVKYLVELMDPETGMVEKAVALLSNLSTIPEGRAAITEEGGIPSLVEVLEMGSQRGKENAASTLLNLCINSPELCGMVLQEGAVPPLVALSQSGTPRAKEKAQQILSHFRNQREGNMGKRQLSFH